jgi:hypothetical protein
MSFPDIIDATRWSDSHMFDIPGYTIHKDGIFAPLYMHIKSLAIDACYRNYLATCRREEASIGGFMNYFTPDFLKKAGSLFSIEDFKKKK